MSSEIDKLDSWKEIAGYLRRDVRTVQRWESSEGLPVHRLFHQKRPSVYAFQSELDEWVESQRELLESEEEASLVGLPGTLWKKVGRWTAGLAAFAVVVFVTFYWTVPEAVDLETDFNAVPITTDLGAEDQATFSSGGNRVAFASRGSDAGNTDIYVEQIRMGSRMRLTTAPERDYSPAWSPDGNSIAYLREMPNGRSQVCIVPSLGGKTSVLNEVATPDSLWGTQLSWTPDNEFLAVTDRDANGEVFLALLNVSTGAMNRLTHPLAGSVGDHSPRFSPSGRLLAYVSSVGERASNLFIHRIGPEWTLLGKPVQMTAGRQLVSSPCWVGEDSLVFSSGSWPLMRLRRVGVKEPLKVVDLEFVSDGAVSPAYTTARKRLVYSKIQPEINIWRQKLSNSAPMATPPSLFLASSSFDWLPTYSRDGSHVTFSSLRLGEDSLWISDQDGADPVPLTRFHGTNSGGTSWSPTGELVAFHSCVGNSCDIFVKKARPCVNEGPVCTEDPCCLKQLTSSDFDDFMPNWSQDGTVIYFSSARSGHFEVWKVPADGGEAVQVTHDGGLFSLESPDGRELFFSKWREPGIWSVPISGGEETKLIDSAFRRFGVSEEGIYYVQEASSNYRGFTIQFYDFATRSSSTLLEIDNRFAWSISVAPDESALLWAQFDHDEADLMLVDAYE